MLKAEKSALVSALASIKGAIQTRNTIPILGNALFERDGEDIVVTGSNLDIQISARCGAVFGPDFKPFTAPFAMLESGIRAMPDGQIAINDPAKSDRFDSVALKAGRASIKLPILPAKDYAKLKTDNLSLSIGLGAKSLKRSLSACEIAMSTEETRYYLNGIFVHNHDRGLAFVATDGAKLTRYVVPGTDIDEEDVPVLPSVIIPRDTVRTITRLLPDAGNVEIRLSDERIEFSFGSMVIVSKLVEGTFPDYQRVRPMHNDKTFRLSTKQLASAIDRVLTVSTEKSNAIIFAFGQETISLRSRPGDASADDEISANGDGSIDIGFNGKFLHEIIGSIDGDDIEIKLGKAGDPALITRPGETETYAVLMPMRI